MVTLGNFEKCYRMRDNSYPIALRRLARDSDFSYISSLTIYVDIVNFGVIDNEVGGAMSVGFGIVRSLFPGLRCDSVEGVLVETPQGLFGDVEAFANSSWELYVELDEIGMHWILL